MTQAFRFSPGPNRAHEVHWRNWSADTFDTATRADRPVLLNLTAVWCQGCRLMDETTYSDPEVIRLLNEEVVPVRVDADRYPHVQDRYIMGGWPTNAFLTPTGEVLWAGTYVAPAEFRAVAEGVLTAWRGRRAELTTEIVRRRRALEAARARHPAVGLVRREAADDVVIALREAFDPRNGGFGGAPKFPPPDAIELLYTLAVGGNDEAARIMAERTLDGMLAGELWDAADGGFRRYALADDWTEPRYEKLLEVNAGLLRSYALGACIEDRRDWRRIAERTVAWVEERLRLAGGLWGGSEAADEEFARLDAATRAQRARPPVDPVVYTGANAAWIRALADAGGRLEQGAWIERAAAALEVLLETMKAPGGLLYHYRFPGGSPSLTGLLGDTVETARACVAVAQATGAARFLERAGRLAAALEEHFWAADGGFLDHVPAEDDVGAVRYRDRPFDRNAAAARLFLDLTHATGERSYRAVAERTLALLSPLAGRYGLAAVEFALAVEEYFRPPLRLVLVGLAADAAPLRAAALTLPDPARRVWTLEAGGRIGALSFAASDRAVAFACGGHSCSPPIADPAGLAAAARLAR